MADSAKAPVSRQLPALFSRLAGFAYFLAAFLLILLRLPETSAAQSDGRESLLVLTEMQAAVDKGDGAAFGKLVDLDAILNNGLDIFLNEGAGNMGLPPVLTLMLSGVGSQPALRKLLLDECRAFVLNNINNGSFAGKTRSGASSQGRFAPLFSNASTGRKEIVEVGQPMRDAEGWILPFTVLDHGNGNYYRIDGWFAEDGGQTRLKAVRNLNELFGIISREAAE